MNHIIFDGSNVLWRAHWVSTQYSAGYEYQDVNIFLHMVHNICTSMGTYNIHMAWDDHEVNDINPRVQTFSSYKQNRSKDNSPYQHVDLIKQLIVLLGGCHYRPYRLEGDDVISILCKELAGSKVIVSADQDLAQLINESTKLYSINKKTTITVDNFQSHFPVPVDHYITYKCILGDKSDNIPGVPRYGTKKAASLAKQIYEGDDRISPDILNIVNTNRQLMDLTKLVDQQEVDYIKSQMINNSPDINTFKSILNEYKLERSLGLSWLNFFLSLK